MGRTECKFIHVGIGRDTLPWLRIVFHLVSASQGFAPDPDQFDPLSSSP